MNYDLGRFLTQLKERKGELQYDLKRAQEHVAELERLIAETDVAIANIERERLSDADNDNETTNG